MILHKRSPRCRDWAVCGATDSLYYNDLVPGIRAYPTCFPCIVGRWTRAETEGQRILRRQLLTAARGERKRS